MTNLLDIEDLHVSVEGKEILNRLNLSIEPGKVHAIMGPNGSGKSTLANVLAGNPKYKVTKGTVNYLGKNLLTMTPDERARNGLLLAFQNPLEIQGVSMSKFLYNIYRLRERYASAKEFTAILDQHLNLLNLERSFVKRELNVGFSGGEKKRSEVLQMLMSKPRFAVLDETDSGLDIDSLQTVSKAVNTLRDDKFGALVITHYQRLLNHIKPDIVHVFNKGGIVETGGMELVEDLEKNGYKKYGVVENEN